MSATDINVHTIHLGRSATAEVEPEFTADSQWYESYGARHADDGVEGRLVGMYPFTDNWDVWEMHPRGSDVVLCVAGSLTLHQEKADGSRATVTLTPGQYAINEPGRGIRRMSRKKRRHCSSLPGSGPNTVGGDPLSRFAA